MKRLFYSVIIGPRNASFHQKQMRFFTLLFGTAAVLLVGPLLWFINHKPH